VKELGCLGLRVEPLPHVFELATREAAHRDTTEMYSGGTSYGNCSS
jgi:hypothetical protein